MLVVFVLVVVVMVVIVMELMSILVVHVVSVFLVVDWLMMSLDFVNHSGLVMSVGVVIKTLMMIVVVIKNLMLFVGVMSLSVMVRLMLTTVGESVMRDLVLHLSTEEDLGEGETDGVTVLIEVLVLPLSLGVHNFVMNILSVHDEVVLNMEDEVPGVCESLGHLTELVEIGADSSLALFELVSNIVNDVTEVLNSMEHSIE